MGSGTYGFAYNARNRLSLAQLNGATVGTYTYNALGQRSGKVTTTTGRYVYDQSSQLLAEYGATNRDYIWLDDVPVAVIDNASNGSVITSTVNYTADQLDTPRAVSDSTGAVIWQWAYQGNPFVEQQPVSGSGYVLNLRFSGQYFDAETGVVGNGFRDCYVPAVGRYCQSDPTGLAGGISTYSYGLNSPLSYVDPTGLAPKDKWFGFNDRNFQWWLHNCYKRPGDPDVDSKAEMAEIYAEYQAADSPQMGRCSNNKKPCPKDDSSKMVAPIPNPVVSSAEADGALEEMVEEGIEALGVLFSD